MTVPKPCHAFGEGIVRGVHAIEPPRDGRRLTRVDRVPKRLARGSVAVFGHGAEVGKIRRGNRVGPPVGAVLENRLLRGADTALQELHVLTGRRSKIETVYQARGDQTLAVGGGGHPRKITVSGGPAAVKPGGGPGRAGGGHRSHTAWG